MNTELFHRLIRTCRPALAGLLLGAGLIAGTLPADACTSLVLSTTDSGKIYGRTMEFAMDMKSQMIALPRRYALQGSGPGRQAGMAWRGKYAAIGMNAFGLPVLLDGMNEKGLAGGILYFPGTAGYAPWDASRRAHPLALWEFLTWALTNFASVAEVKAVLKDVRVADVKQAQMGLAPPVHYTLHDASGASLVTEPMDGQLKVYDNPLGG